MELTKPKSTVVPDGQDISLPGRPIEPPAHQAEIGSENLSMPRLSTLDQLAIKLRALQPGQAIRVATLQSIGYQWNDDETIELHLGNTPLEEALHEPIVVFTMYFDGRIAASGDWRRYQPGAQPEAPGTLLPPPPARRGPRSPLPLLDATANPGLESAGSYFLADFIAPGCERTRDAFNFLSISAAGLSGMSALEVFHAARLARPSVFPPPISWGGWEARSADFASLKPFTPFEPITHILKGSDNAHRAIELHCIFTSVQCYFRATPEPIKLSSHQGAVRTKLSAQEFNELRRSTEEALEPPPASVLLREYDPSEPPLRQPPFDLSRDQTLMLLQLSFEKLATAISQSLPTGEVVGNIFSQRLCNFHPSLGFQMTKSFNVMMDEYNSSISWKVYTHHIDLSEVSLKGDTPYRRREELLQHAFQELPNEPDAPSSPMVSRELLKEVRPHVYNEAERRLIIDAARALLTLMIESDLESNGPRAGTRSFKHLLEVGLLLMLSGERPEVVVAGLFHDIYELFEAHKPAKELEELRQSIRENFGEEVDNLIAAVTEPPKGTRDSKEFFSRKSAIIRKLNSLEFPLRAEVARILCASKISTLLDGLIHMYEKGTAQGWSSGTWAQNVALHTYLLQVFEANHVSSALTANYRAQLVKLGGWARRKDSKTDLDEMKEHLSEYFVRLSRCAHTIDEG